MFVRIILLISHFFMVSCSSMNSSDSSSSQETQADASLDETPNRFDAITNTSLSIGYEDHFDYNYSDTQICLSGSYGYSEETGEVTSFIDQTARIQVKRNSPGVQNIVFSIYSPAEDKNRIIFLASDLENGAEESYTFRFEKDDIIQLEIFSTANNKATLPFSASVSRISLKSNTCTPDIEQ